MGSKVFGLLALVLAAGLLTGAPASAATSVRTFEDEPVGQVPSGCTTPAGTVAAVVSDVRGHESARSLRVADQSTAAITRTICDEAGQAGGELSFAVFPAALANGFLVDLLGTVRDLPGRRTVFHVSVTADGAVRWYDGRAWTQVAPAATVALGRWSTVVLTVPSDGSAMGVSVDGTEAGRAGPVGVREVTGIDGFAAESFGTATTGDDVFLDDVGFGPAQDLPPAPGPFGAGPTTTIEQSVAPLQMPNTAVAAPRAGGTRVLMSYLAHGDDTGGAGNHFARSDDGGVTWTPDQAANPMPESNSYSMSRLRDGRLLTVSYHTYMTAGSGNLRAEVDTAVSADGGATWARRTGSMTAPQAMRPIGSVSDRPGTTLGGFVLVHSVAEDADGTLYQSGYGYYAADPKFRNVLLVSTDGGLTWTTKSTVADDPGLSNDPAYEGFDEGAIARTADGSLLVVLRTGSYLPMYTTRSTDNGATWTQPARLLAGSPAQPVPGVYPTLTPLPNGTLVLLVGRPGLSLLAATDGTGAHWSAPVAVDYQNSANGTFAVLDDAHLVVVGDRGADWSLPAPAPYAVWARPVAVG